MPVNYRVGYWAEPLGFKLVVQLEPFLKFLPRIRGFGSDPR